MIDFIFFMVVSSRVVWLCPMYIRSFLSPFGSIPSEPRSGWWDSALFLVDFCGWMSVCGVVGLNHIREEKE